MSCDALAGHWKLGHTVKNLVIVQAQMLFNFVLFSAVRNSPGLFSSFGFRGRPAFIAFTLFSIISAPLGEVPPLARTHDASFPKGRVFLAHACMPPLLSPRDLRLAGQRRGCLCSLASHPCIRLHTPLLFA
jgi:hypothetical protein